MKRLDSKPVYVAYSGGVDSHALLHAMVGEREQCPELKLKAIHVNHQLQADSKKWAAHCQQICDALNVELVQCEVAAEPTRGEGPEAAARHARYQVFSEVLPKDALLLVAQHQDDQAETLLLQLLRGAGPKGLSGMAPLMRREHYFVMRPFLNISKKEILAYAKAHKLSWIEDQSNKDVSFDRNYIRHKVMPLLNELRPAASGFARSARLCAESAELLSELAAMDLKSCCLREASCSHDTSCHPRESGDRVGMTTVSVEALKELSVSRMKNTLRFWFAKNNLPMPSEKKMGHIISDVILSRHDAKPVIEWGSVRLRREKKKLFFELSF